MHARPIIGLLFVFVTACQALAQQPTLCRWAHDAKGAYSLTLDDNLVRQLTVVRPLMNARGIHATFFVPDPASQTNGALLTAAVAEGHEIGSHTLTHSDLTLMDSATADNEMARSKHIIDSLYPAQRCVCLAYPYCTTDSLVAGIAARYYLASRTCGGPSPIIAPNPPDMQRISAVEFAGDQAYGPTLTSSALNYYVDQALRGGWVITLCHDFDGTGTGWISSDTFRTHLDYIVGKGDQLYCAPFGTVVRYIKERQAAAVSISTQSSTGMTLALTDTLADTALYDIAVTVKTVLTTVWTSVSVTQNGAPRWWVLRGDTLVLEGTPNAGPIVVTGSIGVRHTAETPGRAHPDSPNTAGLFTVDGRRVTGSAEAALRLVRPERTK